jgi:hypothetical protein
VVTPPGAPPALALVAQRFADTSRGIVSFHLHRVFDVHAGFAKRHEDLVMDGVSSDGEIVKVHVSSYTIDGKAADAVTLSTLVQAYEHPAPGASFNPPFDPRYVAAYQYQSAGPQKIAFTSGLRDAAHGNGSFSFDASGDVLSYTYQPNVLPPHASFGEITDRRSEALPGYWAVVEETQQYRGSYGPFPGAGTVEVTFSDFRRFTDLPTALKSLPSSEPSSS